MANFFTVNMKLLPIKLHYFFFYGAIGGVFHYMQLVAKNLGINATAVGLIYTVLAFFLLFSNPIFGYLIDYFQNITVILFILIIITAVSYLLILLIPPIGNDDDVSVPIHFNCTEYGMLFYPANYDKSCFKEEFKQKVHLDLIYKECHNNTFLNIRGILHERKFETDHFISENDSGCVSNVEFLNFYIETELEENNTCNCIENNSSFIMNIHPNIIHCFCETEMKYPLVYTTYQFWIFALLAALSNTGSSTVCCLSDSACYEVLGDHPELYGQQRLWATISWGAITAFSGFLNDLVTETSRQIDYSAGFYLMLALILVDLIVLFKVPLKKANFSTNICKDIGKIFSSCETIAFAVAVYMIGVLTGVLWNYEFWFLQDIGASQTLLGLSVAVQSLAAEVPFFFFSGWIVKKFGYFICLSFSFAAFGLRFIFYYFLKNPWLVLLIELLHGFTFSVFHTSMTAYAAIKAPPGTEATMMGILGGVFEGLGVGAGSLLGGVGFDKLGGRYTFLAAGFVGFINVPVILVFSFFMRKPASST